ncbi:transglycosylase SLT domain-containing protein [Acidocella aminolytica]|uniref:Secretion system type IV VirB1/lytic transglycosylase n=1 Tax=Acidocella aminolytica 101 = DSM 11237 TaxID=1120923 RepID=A0A0D6PGY1_9PROT|nr:transglycosylase SLT domain-containing protein [Acidocella aminolytica]GAN80606.1 secretion system type IV VirB1/lytic transglycosylase [Acidocella aminolytica 101 = DSM 11237]GBQ43155.1 type IV secretion system lytic transglycosylase VirB1 [Acidocella aminolytica 101 = DSM 11237]SHF22431.1 type IV secretion system protein VirB1 [Acidocella aminolytica 101 = DSM 11237]
MSEQRDRLTRGPSLAVVSFVGLTSLMAFAGPPAQATSASAVSAARFSILAGRCAPAVPEWVLGAVARTESNFHPWRLHDNTARVSSDPPSLEAAETEAAAWMAAGHSVDLGLMQINSGNLPALGMNVNEALDPCASLAAGAAVLRAAYGGGPVKAGQQAALLMALSVYNTGSPLKGIMNGYARTVMRNASAVPLSAPLPQAQPDATPDMPPAWNVSATGNYTQVHGAPWLVPLGLDMAGNNTAAAAESGSPHQTMRSP